MSSFAGTGVLLQRSIPIPELHDLAQVDRQEGPDRPGGLVLKDGKTRVLAKFYAADFSVFVSGEICDFRVPIVTKREQ